MGGKGWKNGKDRTIGYNIGYLNGNYEFIGVYGWTNNPPVEYYVIEKGNGGIDGSYTFVKDVYSNGNHYKFYKKYIQNKPAAVCSSGCDFWQYKNVRQNQTGINKNQSVNMYNHAKNWRKYANGFGHYVQYQVLAIEAYSGNYSANGSINATVW